MWEHVAGHEVGPRGEMGGANVRPSLTNLSGDL